MQCIELVFKRLYFIFRVVVKLSEIVTKTTHLEKMKIQFRQPFLSSAHLAPYCEQCLDQNTHEQSCWQVPFELCL